ncbi:MAG TPA: phosphonate C-P lyase system protein PhnH [Trebonia sp.]|nr:phosphonate C-P lyase system protein PhnH [Trebonia sp.]
MPATTIAPLSSAQSQLVFRAVMEALTRPGTVHRLPVAADAGGLPAALLPVLALADLGTPACVLADGGQWADVVRAMTLAPAAGLAQARLVAALRSVTGDELASLRTGTPEAPEDGALACLSVASIRPLPSDGSADGADSADGDLGTGGGSAGGDGRLLRLSGPGIPGATGLVVTGLPSDFVAVRRELTGGFPVGADLLLVTPDGDLAGLPRTTLIDEEAR